MLVVALVRGPDDGWGSTLIVGLLIGAAALLGVFLLAEWRQRDPMLDLTLFKRPAMVGVSLAASPCPRSIFAMFLYLTLYIQDDLGYGPLAAGVRFLPITVLAFVVAFFAGKLTVRIQARFLLGTGLLLIAGGCLLMATTTPRRDGPCCCPVRDRRNRDRDGEPGPGIVGDLGRTSQQSGMASGTNSTFRQVGIATGIAGLGAVFQTQILHRTHERARRHRRAGRQWLPTAVPPSRAHLSAATCRRRSPRSRRSAARAALLLAYRVGFSATLNQLMVIAAVIAFIGAVGSFVLVRQRDFVPSFAPPTGATQPGSSSGEVREAGVAPAKVSE